MDVQISIPPPPPPPPPPFFAETTAPQLTSPPPAPPPQPVTTTAAVASPPTQDRIWLHPWTVTEMREHASRWSLAGDAGLLLYLEQFSDKLIQRADTIQQHLNQTVNAVKSTHTRVENCLNEFTSLANTQFIENRVYDEDETASTGTSKKDEQSTEKANVSNTEAQEKVLQRYVEAIQYGLAVLDTHFESVDPKLENRQHIGASFADDDEDGGIPIEPILEPKDPYIFRPLPYLIGTTEFMDDDYVGLGDLLNLHDEDGYGAEQIKNPGSDSALSSSDEEDGDIKVEVESVGIVPAGASRPDLANRAPPPTATTNLLTDSEEDDDDPFGMNNPTFNNFSKEKSKVEDARFEESTIPTKPNKSDFNSDEDDTGLFGIPTNKAPPIFDKAIDNESTTSNDSDDTEKSNHRGGVSMFGNEKKGMSALEEAILKRRIAMGDPNSSSDDDGDKSIKKPTKKPDATISSPGIKKTKKTSSDEPSSTTISTLTSQPLTKPDKTSKPSIFGGHTLEDENDDEIFGDPPKSKVLPPSQPIVDTKPPLIIAPKTEKDIFDNDTDEDDDPFKIKGKVMSSSQPIQKIESNPKIQPARIPKPKAIIQQSGSDEDEIFGAIKTQPKKIPTVSTATVVEKPKSPSSEDDLFSTSTVAKSKLPPKTTKTSDDEDRLFVNKPPVQQPAAPVVPPVKNPVSDAERDSDDELFGISKTKQKALTTETPKSAASVKSDELFGTSTSKSKIPTTETQKIIPPLKHDEDDDDDEIFSPKPSKIQLPPPVVLPPLPPAPKVTSDVYEDSLLGVKKSIETTPKPPAIIEPIKTPIPPRVVQREKSSSDSDEDLVSKRPQNTGVLKDGEKPNVKDLLSRLKIDPNAHRGGARPKAQPITVEAPKPSLDDEEPIQKVEPPPPTIVKKLPNLDSDSDDELFNNKKKQTPAAPIVEQKDKTNVASESGRANFKDLSDRIKTNLTMGIPGALPKPISTEDSDSNNTKAASSTETRNEEPTADKTMLNILKDRAKVSVKTRTPPTRKPRSTGAAASANENDDLFALPNSTNSVTSSPASPPPPTAVPIIPPPTAVPIILPATAVPVIPPPTVVPVVLSTAPVTGLPNTAALSAKQSNSKEKKKFSLFDSDDSDIDELLFGFNKKNKSPIVSKPTTTSKVPTKASLPPLDDDDDFLSKRPNKKSTKPMDNDDIFADVKIKSQQTNKAKKDWSILEKPIDNPDDIFNDTTKSSGASKSKSITVKSKSNKDVDDIFDDPLNVSSKR